MADHRCFTKNAIEVMQAYVDGKRIEERDKTSNYNKWYGGDKFFIPEWDWSDCEYRVASDPVDLGEDKAWDREDYENVLAENKYLKGVIAAYREALG